MGGTSGGSRDAQMRKLVAKYMPAASRRGGGNLIAQAPAEPVAVVAEADVRPATTAVASAAAALPNKGPVPDFRYDSESAGGVEMAYASTKRASDNPVLAPNTLDAQSARLGREPESGGVDSQITNSVATAETAPAMAEAHTEANIELQGWVIQIGATPDKTQAMTLLDNAKEKGGKALRNATPFTVAFSSGGAQLYRARFGGFDDQDKAVNACKALKKKGFACWASQQ